VEDQLRKVTVQCDFASDEKSLFLFHKNIQRSLNFLITIFISSILFFFGEQSLIMSYLQQINVLDFLLSFSMIRLITFLTERFAKNIILLYAASEV
jgi:hypothetical protein